MKKVLFITLAILLVLLLSCALLVGCTDEGTQTNDNQSQQGESGNSGDEPSVTIHDRSSVWDPNIVTEYVNKYGMRYPLQNYRLYYYDYVYAVFEGEMAQSVLTGLEIDWGFEYTDMRLYPVGEPMQLLCVYFSLPERSQQHAVDVLTKIESISGVSCGAIVPAESQGPLVDLGLAPFTLQESVYPAQDPTLKPFAEPDPNNPYDKKTGVPCSVDQVGDTLHISVILTNSESVNNLYAYYMVEDFGIEYTQYGEFEYRYVEGYGLADVFDPPHRNMTRYSPQSLRDEVSNGNMAVLSTYTRTLIISFPEEDNMTAEEIVEIVNHLNSLSYVKEASPYEHWGWFSTTPTGYAFGNLWGHESINVRDAWDYSTGAGVSIGVIDTGINNTHSALVGKVNETLSDGPDDPFDDLANHGTAVAGIICANGYNGVYGVSYNSTVASLKGCYGAQYEDPYLVTSAISNAEGIFPILNFSGGFGTVNTPISEGQRQALEGAIANYGGLIVVAAGNDGWDLDSTGYNLYPHNSGLDNVLVVGALTTYNTIRSDSNYGANTVDIYAPGTNIYCANAANNTGFISYDQTSMAAPFVTGVAALLLSLYPTMTPAMLKAAIVGQADDLVLGGQYGTVKKLNAAASVSYIYYHTHTCTYTSDATGHSGTCTICGYDMSGSHTYDNTYTHTMTAHRQTCTACGYHLDTVFTYMLYNDYYHKTHCLICNTYWEQLHVWEQQGPIAYRCTRCGKLVYGVPIVHDSIEIPEGSRGEYEGVPFLYDGHWYVYYKDTLYILQEQCDDSQ